jgi:hypothetical protein
MAGLSYLPASDNAQLLSTDARASVWPAMPLLGDLCCLRCHVALAAALYSLGTAMMDDAPVACKPRSFLADVTQPARPSAQSSLLGVLACAAVAQRADLQGGPGPRVSRPV